MRLAAESVGLEDVGTRADVLLVHGLDERGCVRFIASKLLLMNTPRE